LEQANRAAKDEAAAAVKAEQSVARELKHALEQAEVFEAKAAHADRALAQAQQQAQQQVQQHPQQPPPRARELTASQDAAADVQAAFAATSAPAGSLRLAVCVPNLQRLTQSSSSESLVALAAAAPETALAVASTAQPNARPRRLLYVCDGSLPVSWLLSMVLRDCDERADVVGLRRPRPTTTAALPARPATQSSQGQPGNSAVAADVLPSGRMLDLSADLREVVADGDVLEAVLDEQTSQLLRQQRERRLAFAQQGPGRIATEPTELLFAAGGLANKPRQPSAKGAGSAANVPTAEAFRVQRSVLTNWVNFKVAPRRGCFVGHLFTDLADGVLLKHLLEVITGEDIDDWAAHNEAPPPRPTVGSTQK
jgi:hypothetical protein